jgi:hypothetical protein
LKAYKLGLQIFALVNAILPDKNVLLRHGTVVENMAKRGIFSWNWN